MLEVINITRINKLQLFICSFILKKKAVMKRKFKESLKDECRTKLIVN